MERARRSGSGSSAKKDATASAAAVLKKGPWTAEEDEVLMEYVREHGPRDWSCIRTGGLLPRSGKSCRLRWVNKLKPDLKTGCKFSAEEEKTVIDLQARFGNKWARIATFLPGRTDNDVKNFWSTRQKRLARMLKQNAALPAPPLSWQKKKKKKKINQQKKNSDENSHHQQSNLLLLPVSTSSMNQDPCSMGDCSKPLPVTQNCGSSTWTPDFMELQPLEPNPHRFTPLEASHRTHEAFKRGCLLEAQPLQFIFPDLPNTLLDLPLVPEDHPFNLGFDEIDVFLDEPFTTQSSMDTCGDAFSGGLPFVKTELNQDDPAVGTVEVDDMISYTSNISFDDFPVDMIDLPDPVPPPS